MDIMSKVRKGAVIVFKEGMSDEDCRKALKRIADVLDDNVYANRNSSIREFEPQYGGPVWYIP
jgi:hypothetical protein